MITKEDCPLALDVYDHFDLLEDSSTYKCIRCNKAIWSQKFKTTSSYVEYTKCGMCQACQDDVFDTVKRR